MKSITITSALVACATLVNAASIGKPLVESNKLRRTIYRSELMKKAHQLQGIADRNNGVRNWGSSGHWETVHWIYDTLSATGYYDVEYQYFNISSTAYDKLAVDFSDGTKPTDIRGFNGGSSGTVEAQLVYVPNLGCNATDFPAAVAGKIAFVQRGTCVQGLKNALAKAAGAVGVISYNNDNPPPDPPRLGSPSEYNITEFLVSAFIDKPTGQAVLAKIQGGATISAKIESVSRVVDTLTANVIAETKGGDHNAVITTGAHSDSVKAGPGINDDGSGTMSTLEVALALTKFSVNQAVRWCFWSAEEDGLLGSYYYTQHLSKAEADKIVLNMDFDMLASPNYVYSVYDGDGSTFGKEFSGPDGAGQIEQTFIDFFKDINEPTIPTQFDGRSDYVGFNDIGIPAGGIAMGAEGIKTAEEVKLFGGVAGEQYDQCYHEACDTVDNLNMKAWIAGTKCVADAIAKYARSIEGFPFPRAASAGLKKREAYPFITERGSMIPNDRRSAGRKMSV